MCLFLVLLCSFFVMSQFAIASAQERSLCCLGTDEALYVQHLTAPLGATVDPVHIQFSVLHVEPSTFGF